MTPERIEALPHTTFEARGIKERSDLQRLLRANIGVVTDPDSPHEPSVLIIAEEFAEWEDSKRRIDLLGVDEEAKLVVIELKRDEEGGHMELQAVRYAAMVSAMTFARAVEVFQAYLDKDNAGQNAQAKLLDFLGWSEPREDDFGQDTRIVLVAAEFSKELTTTVFWLNERDLDIRCVRLKPYANGEQTIVDAQQVVPLPEAEERTIQLKQKVQAVRQEKEEGHQLSVAFWKELIPVAAPSTPRFARIAPGTSHWISASSGVAGVEFSYLAWKASAGVEIYIDRGIGSDTANKAIYDYLFGRRLEIETAYGRPLTWMRLDDKRACRVTDKSINGGVKSPREQWAATHHAMVDAMKRFEAAIGPYLQAALAHAIGKS